MPKEEKAVELKPRPKIKASVNNFALAGIIFDNKKTNERLDREELDRANQQFKKIDRSERKAVLMSSYINHKIDNNRDEYVMDFVNGEYVKIFKPFVCDFKNCGKRFRFSTEINDHLESHKIADRDWAHRKAEEFASTLFKK